MLHEAIPITGSLVSGTYGGGAIAVGSEPHIKSFSHGMFQSVYDYPYLSSSANQIFDITVGVSPSGSLYSHVTSQQAKKRNIYNQMAQVLMGHDVTGSIQEFDKDGNILAGGAKLREVFFLNFSRLLTKDEIKKGSFQLELGTEAAYSENGNNHVDRILITDASGSNGYFVNSPAGEYGILFAKNSTASEMGADSLNAACGLLFYQAGVAVISGSVFGDELDGGLLGNTPGTVAMSALGGAANHGFRFITGSTIDVCANAIRSRIRNVQFNNTTELNSSIYFCRANHNDFNYSSNPTYLSGSKIRVKESTVDTPVSYITSVGLYSADNELLAVAKLSEPLRKDPSTELTLRVRLDY